MLGISECPEIGNWSVKIGANEFWILFYKDCSTNYKSKLYRKRNGGVIVELNLDLNKEVALGWETRDTRVRWSEW